MFCPGLTFDPTCHERPFARRAAHTAWGGSTAHRGVRLAGRRTHYNDAEPGPFTDAPMTPLFQAKSPRCRASPNAFRKFDAVVVPPGQRVRRISEKH